jgi:hypothetical protein
MRAITKFKIPVAILGMEILGWFLGILSMPFQKEYDEIVLDAVGQPFMIIHHVVPTYLSAALAIPAIILVFFLPLVLLVEVEPK